MSLPFSQSVAKEAVCLGDRDSSSNFNEARASSAILSLQNCPSVCDKNASVYIKYKLA